MRHPCRIGLIVPSSNTTIETELPELFRRQAQADGSSFTFHSSRAVLHNVDAESLDRMVEQIDRCVTELTDARVDAYAYACLVALMARGPAAHIEAERRIEDAIGHSEAAVVVSSAGAIVRAISHLGWRKLAIVTPYVDELTKLVVDYIEADGTAVVDAVGLRVSDNLDVGRLDPARLPDIAARMDTEHADGVIISACVQMPSLSALAETERRVGLPVISAASATVWDLLQRLGRSPSIPGGGALLDPTAIGHRPAGDASLQGSR